LSSENSGASSCERDCSRPPVGGRRRQRPLAASEASFFRQPAHPPQRPRLSTDSTLVRPVRCSIFNTLQHRCQRYGPNLRSVAMARGLQSVASP
jgi:hypothetical protein